jgi:8-oxo-dGTP pyrophosphatase MutT (NUDIX family)
MPDVNIDQKDPYFVAVKVFLERDGKFLVFKDNFGDWDLPGGRIKKDEFAVPLEDIVKRKMFEEVGVEVGGAAVPRFARTED